METYEKCNRWNQQTFHEQEKGNIWMTKLMSLKQLVRTKYYTLVKTHKLIQNGCKLRTNGVQDKNSAVLADSHNILNRWKITSVSYWLNMQLVMLDRLKYIQLNLLYMRLVLRYKLLGTNHIPAELIQQTGKKHHVLICMTFLILLGTRLERCNPQ
jgi:hypothetical protein